MTIDEYMAAQPENIREILASVRNTITTAIPEAEERISFQMPTWWRVHNLIHFAAQKKHLGIYPRAEGVEAFVEEIESRGLKHSKGTIRFPYDKVDLELIGRIAAWCGRNNCG